MGKRKKRRVKDGHRRVTVEQAVSLWDEEKVCQVFKKILENINREGNGGRPIGVGRRAAHITRRFFRKCTMCRRKLRKGVNQWAWLKK